MLTTQEKIEAALALVAGDDSYSHLTISKFCKLANVNRANLYERYPELLDKIRQLRPEKRKSLVPSKQASNFDREELVRLKTQYKNLLRIALEQQAEIEWLRKLVRQKR
jgi:AcrR family transcriptional regulator